MTVNRLENQYDDLAILFETANGAARRRAAQVACQRAVEAAGLCSTTVEKALGGILQPDAQDVAALREELSALSEHFDEIYFDLAENEPTNRDAILREFGRARVHSALAFALTSDDRLLHDAIYEALKSTADEAIIRSEVALELLR